MEITIECFGAFRNFGDEVSVTLHGDITVSDLRGHFYDALQKIDTNFDNKNLLERSRFATDTEVLADNAPLTKSMRLAIIPPVSGG